MSYTHRRPRSTYGISCRFKLQPDNYKTLNSGDFSKDETAVNKEYKKNTEGKTRNFMYAWQ